jgi:hypothetical protein
MDGGGARSQVVAEVTAQLAHTLQIVRVQLVHCCTLCTQLCNVCAIPTLQHMSRAFCGGGLTLLRQAIRGPQRQVSLSVFLSQAVCLLCLSPVATQPSKYESEYLPASGCGGRWVFRGDCLCWVRPGIRELGVALIGWCFSCDGNQSQHATL